MREWVCPYWMYERKLMLVCEAGCIKFPSREAWDDYVDGYCDNPQGWKDCTLAQNLCRDYERKELQNAKQG